VNLLDKNGSLVDSATYPGNPSDQQRYLRITEVMYHPAAGGAYNEEEYEYVELTNIGSSPVLLDGTKFTGGIDYAFTAGDNAHLDPGEHIVIVKNMTAFASRYYTGAISLAGGVYTGSLENHGETVKFEDDVNNTILEFDYEDDWYGVTDGDGFSLTIKDVQNTDQSDWGRKSSWRTSARSGGSPGRDDSGEMLPPGTVVINEVLAHAHAEASDWIELHNTTNELVDIGGWFLSDNAVNNMKYEIADGTFIDPCGYIVFYEDPNFGVKGDPGTHEEFALNENGDAVYLHVGRGGELMGLMDQEDFGASLRDVSFGRYITSTGDDKFPAMCKKTPRAENSYPRLGPVVITEIMYHPSDPYYDDPPQYNDDDDFEYIELYNMTDSLVWLQEWDNDNGRFVPWWIRGIGFTFPANTTIEAHSFLVIARRRDAFAHRYGNLPTSVLLAEDYYDPAAPGEHKLSNSGESIQLVIPGDENTETALDPSDYHPIRVDRVEYDDGLPWPPTLPDGNGYSLRRIRVDRYGNDPNNWQASEPTPGLM